MFASTLVINLSEEFKREIGLKSLTVEGLSTLDTKTIKKSIYALQIDVAIIKPIAELIEFRRSHISTLLEKISIEAIRPRRLSRGQITNYGINFLSGEWCLKVIQTRFS
jgi:hypothetical protein